MSGLLGIATDLSSLTCLHNGDVIGTR